MFPKSFATLVLSLLSIAPLLAQWKLINPLPTNNNLTGMVLPPGGRGLAVGLNGTVLITSDGGDSWRIARTDSFTHLRSIATPDSVVALICGDKGLIIKTDMGFTRADTIESGRYGNLNKIYFINKDVGFCIGNDRVVLKTADGGAHWTAFTVNHACDLRDLSFPDPSVGYLTGYYYVPMSNWCTTLYRTRNQGASWELVDTLAFEVNAISFTDTLTGVLASYEMHRTTDGGRTWKETMLNDSYFTGMFFRNKLEGRAINYEGAIVKTTDGGVSWSGMRKSATANLILPVGPDSMAAFGYGGDIWLGPAAGGTWSRKGTGDRHTLEEIKFIDDKKGFILGDSVIYRTHDSGITWQISNLPVGNVDDAAFADANRCLVRTWEGIWLSEDGCVTWQRRGVSLPKSTLSLAFADSRTAYITGVEYGHFFAYSVVLKSTDGGLNWEADSLPGKPIIANMYFMPNGTGFAMGFSGGLYKKSAGSQAWTAIQGTASGFRYRNMSFPSTTTGYAIGVYTTSSSATYNEICKTTDGGENWTPVYQDDRMFTPELTGVWFTDELSGYVTVADGRILKTTDGGATWQVDFCTNTLTGISGTKLGVWAIGDYGTILTSNGDSNITDSAGNPLHPLQADLIRAIYPNPFLSETDIRLAITDEGPVNIRITDLAGRQVGGFTGSVPAGEFTWHYDGTALRPGIYLLTVRSGRAACSARMVKIKRE